MELVTIILTTLNSERFVARSIESCLEQTYPALELLVVDGGSTDQTLEIIAGYDDPRIRLIHQHDNAGKLPGAINLGMANAKGGFITWTQDDCWYEPDAIDVMMAYLADHAGVAMVYTDYWFVDKGGRALRIQRAGNPEHIASGGDIVGQCFLFRRVVYEVVGPQEVGYFPVHEVPWRIKVSRAFKIAPLHRILMHYRLHEHSLTGKIGAWDLQHMNANALLRAGYLNARTHKQRIARLHVDQAYHELVLAGDYRAFWSHLISGWRLDPVRSVNVGTVKLLLMSVSPWRRQYRERLYSNWQITNLVQHAEDDGEQPIQSITIIAPGQEG